MEILCMVLIHFSEKIFGDKLRVVRAADKNVNRYYQTDYIISWQLVGFILFLIFRRRFLDILNGIIWKKKDIKRL